MAIVMDPAPYFQRNYGTKGRASDHGVKAAIGPNDWAWTVKALHDLGWPLQGGSNLLVFDAVQCFQEMWGLGDRLGVDRFPGKITRAALRECLKADGYFLPNFTTREVRDWRTGWIRCRYELGAGCQGLRTKKRRALSSASWYRMRSSNAAVGGSSGSRHQYAEATDPRYTFGATLRDCYELGAFSAIGVVGPAVTWESVAVHVDVGGLCDKGSNRANRMGGVSNPMVWPYDPNTGRFLRGMYLNDWNLRAA